MSQSAIWSLGRFSFSFEFFVSLAYWLGAFTFVALFPYMLNIIGLLKSENIIKRFAIEITRDKLLKYIEEEKIVVGFETNTVDDPIQPIVDIIHASIMKYDLETTRVGLNAVTERVVEIIGPDKEKEISRRFCEHLELISRLAISKMDEKTTIEVLTNLGIFGRWTVEKGLKVATSQVALSLGEVGKAAAEHGLDFATRVAVESLGEVGLTAAEHGLVGVTRETVWSLGEVGWTAVEKGLVGVTLETAWTLAKLTILSEEIVKTTIQNYESNLEEQNRDAFQEFMKMYEQELEKLPIGKGTQKKKTESG